MPINVECMKCGGRFRAPDTAAGMQVKCPKCSTLIEVGSACPQQSASQPASAPCPENSSTTPSAGIGSLPIKPERHIRLRHSPPTRLFWRYVIPLTGIVLVETVLVLVAVVQATSGVKHIVRTDEVVDSSHPNPVIVRGDTNECVLVIQTKDLSWRYSDIRLSVAGESRKPCIVHQEVIIAHSVASCSPISEVAFFVPKSQSEFVLELGSIGEIPISATGSIRAQYDLATNAGFPAIALAIAFPVLCVVVYIMARVFKYVKSRRMPRSGPAKLYDVAVAANRASRR